MLGIRCVGEVKCQSEDSFVCFGEKPTQRGLRTRCPTRPAEDAGKKVHVSKEETEQISR